MKIVDVAQNSIEWLQARSGVITASEMGNLFTADFELRTGEMLKTYLARKVAEKRLGGPLPGHNVLDMEFGKILEEEALPFFHLEYGEPVQRVGFVTTDDGQIGASPDGLIGDDCGLEIKCPRDETHVKYLLENRLPPDYAAQVHGGMFVTGRPRWVFMSYCRRFPPFRIVVQRDPEIQEDLAKGLDLALRRLALAYQTLVDKNGGEPVKRPLQATLPEINATLDAGGEIIP